MRGGDREAMREEQPKHSIVVVDRLFSEVVWLVRCSGVGVGAGADVTAPSSPTPVHDYITWQSHRGQGT